MESKFWEFPTLQKAKDFAKWNNFQHSFYDQQKFYAVDGPEHYAVINQEMLEELEATGGYELPSSYEHMTWEEVKVLYQDKDVLEHWEKLIGSIQSMDGRMLRFILQMKIPLHLLICYELAARGYDKQIQWVGFEKAEEIWKNVYDETVKTS